MTQVIIWKEISHFRIYYNLLNLCLFMRTGEANETYEIHCSTYYEHRILSLIHHSSLNPFKITIVITFKQPFKFIHISQVF